MTMFGPTPVQVAQGGRKEELVALLHPSAALEDLLDAPRASGAAPVGVPALAAIAGEQRRAWAGQLTGWGWLPLHAHAALLLWPGRIRPLKLFVAHRESGWREHVGARPCTGGGWWKLVLPGARPPPN